MPNFTDDEIRQHDEGVRNAARADLENTLVKDTSWKTLDAVVESAKNADRRIGEAVAKEKEASTKITTLEQQLAEFKKANPVPGGDDKNKVIDDGDPAVILATMTDKESAQLDELVKADPELKKQVASGGEKAMAKALLTLRKIVPAGDGSLPDSLFSAYKKKASAREKPLEEVLKEAHERFVKRRRGPVISLGGNTQQVVEEDPDKRPVRGGGGMLEFAAEAQQD